MRLRVQKWGNSLALRIPKPFAEDAHVKQGSMIDLCVADGRIVATPLRREKWTLARLLAGVSKKNLHDEGDFSSAVGREAW
jgi:antitoxin MazE